MGWFGEMNIMKTVKRFSGFLARKKINNVFLFFFLSKRRFCIHFSSFHSFFMRLIGLTLKTLSKMAFFMNVMQFCELGALSDFFPMPIFMGSLEGRIYEHQKRPNFIDVHFFRLAYGR
jgi:hypothetical protein